MKTQKSVIFVKKSLKLNMWETRDEKARDHCHYTGEYRGATYSIGNSKYSAPKKLL